jgi:GMP synthase (glutamine-hydrolysing)
VQVVLLQIREDEAAAAQERLCFLEACGLEPDELRCINLVHEPSLSWPTVAGARALLVGGAGSHSATLEYDFTSDLESVIGRTVEVGKPLFGSCFGHHVLVKALGGQVVNDQQTGEIGTFEVELTPAGQRDPLLDGFPGRFATQLGHHDRVAVLPDGLVELARSRRCRYQMLRVSGQLGYSTQFHCEMSEEHLRVRLEMYRDTYLSERAAREEVSRSLRASPWADKLLGRFMRRLDEG